MKQPRAVTVAADAAEFVSQRQAGRATVGDLVQLRGGGVGRVVGMNARARTLSVRPIPGATVAGLDKARTAFRAFTGQEPTEVITADVGSVPRVAWLLGELEEVLYNARRDGRKERYLHPFKRSARPMLAVDAETGQLVLVGGRYTVTERGITDH